MKKKFGLIDNLRTFPRRWALIALASGVIPPAGWACDRPPNPLVQVLANPGFETDADLDGTPDGWTSTAPALRTTAVAHRDAASIHVTGPATVTLSQNVTLKRGQRYAFSGHVRTLAATGNGVRFRLIETDPSTVVQQTAFVKNSTGTWSFPFDWMDMQSDHRAGRFEVQIDITGGEAWVDDVAVCEGQEHCDRPVIVSFGNPPGALGVSRTAPVSVAFNEPMPYASANLIGLELVQSTISLGNNQYPPGVDVPGLRSPTTDSRTSDYRPDAPLKSLSWYRLSPYATIRDLDGMTMDGFIVCFQTAMDKTTANTVNGNGVQVQIPANALPADGRLDISTAAPAAAVAAATQKLQRLAGDVLRAPLPGGVVNATLYDDTGARVTSNLNTPATVVIPYTDADNDGRVDGTQPPVLARTLSVYVLDEAGANWERLPSSSVDLTTKKVTARTPHFSVFALIGQLATDLSAVNVYPVPFRRRPGHTAITFAGIGQGARIRVYSVSGELIREINAPVDAPRVDWDVATDRGVPVASGVYFYTIESGSNMKKGKLIILR